VSDLPFIPGTYSKKSLPLSRFLPPLPEGITSTCLERQFPQITSSRNPWILDPFGVNPQSIIEMARAGFRILVTANNPVLRFYIELLAQPPSESEFLAALAELSSSYKGDERIETIIRSLYMTECEKCGVQIQVQAFLWDKGASSPYGRIYSCPNCGDSGEKLVSPADIDRAKAFTSGGLHRARALERVASLNDPDRQYAEEALDTYLPRSIFVLLTLVNKLDSLPSHRRTLTALLLSVFDQATTLWSYPTQRARPKLLTIPPHFRENNIWQALVNSVEQWTLSNDLPPVPITLWPEQPAESGGICLFSGRLRDLPGTIKSSRVTPHDINPLPTFEAMVTTIPRPNQAFWTLSALWTGWLWGKTAAAPFKSVLRRRRYDWQWLYHALVSTFNASNSILRPNVPVLLLIGEAESGFLLSSSLSLIATGFKIGTISLREEMGQVQINCLSPDKTKPAESTESSAFLDITNHVHKATQSLLSDRNEPVSYLHILSASLLELSQKQKPGSVKDEKISEFYSQVSTTLNRIFSTSDRYVCFNKSDYSLDIGKWWHDNFDYDTFSPEIKGLSELSLSDRVEIMVVNHLLKNQSTTFVTLDDAACQSFPGLLTPDQSLVFSCLSSYGLQVTQDRDVWKLRDEDQPENRRQDLKRVVSLVSKLGSKLGFSVNKLDLLGNSTKIHPILWINYKGEPVFVFYCQASALLSKVFFQNEFPAKISILVIPGGRSGLIDYKLNNDPRLSERVESGWRFLKFRHLYHLAENVALTSETFEATLDQDVIIKSDTQIPLF
jgi:hypothetical protein